MVTRACLDCEIYFPVESLSQRCPECGMMPAPTMDLAASVLGDPPSD